MTEANADFEFNAETLDEATLGLLVQLDEALRSGKDVVESLDSSWPAGGGPVKSELAAAALCLLELEAAFPRAARLPQHETAQVELPKQIGRFEIESQIGAGGFGVVYRGRDPELNRLVAIKVPRHHAFAEPALRRRFVREAHAAAQLDHPHIVSIYESGEVENLPFIAFAYCDGPTLARWCADQQELMTPREAANLVLKLVKAIHYIHTRGILHRDIKPSNVLLFPAAHTGDQSFPFTPKLADLGLAKLLESELDETASALLLGTPTFMSPEQAQGAVVGPTSDVYSLGATLYFTLTGRPPFVAAHLTDLLKQLVECDAVEPKSLNFAVSADLNTICMKCLEKNPSRRYASAAALADDLERYLDGMPINARPISGLLRLRRWCQRKPAVALLTACVCLLAIGLLGTLSFNSYRLSTLSHQLAQRNDELVQTVKELDQSLEFAKQQQQSARDSERKTLQLLYVTDAQAAGEAWNKRDFSSAARLLNAHADTRAMREFSGRYLDAQLSATSQEKLQLGAQIWHVSRSHTGKLLAVGDAKGLVHLVEIGDRMSRRLSWDTGQREVNCVSFSSDDKLLATAGDDGRIGVWNSSSGELLYMLEAFDHKPVYGIAFAQQDQKLVACGNTPDLLVWDLATRTLVHRQTTPHTRGIEAISLSPDERHVGTVGQDGAMRIFAIDSLEMVLECSTGSKLSVVQFEPQGKFILAGDKEGQLYIWNAKTGDLQYRYRTADPIGALSVSPNGDIALSDSGGAIYRLHAAVYRSSPDPLSDSEPNGIRVSVVDDRRVAGLVATADDASLITGNSKGALERWNAKTSRDLYLAGGVAKQFTTQFMRFAKQRPNTLLRTRGSALEYWDVETGQLQRRWQHDEILRACQVNSQGNLVILGDAAGRVGTKRLDNDRQVVWYKVFEGREADQVDSFAQNRYLVARSETDDLAIFDVEKQTCVARFPNQGAFDISPDERWLVCGKAGTNDLQIIDLQSLRVVRSLPAHTTSIWDVEFSADGTLLLTCSGDRTAKVWTTHDWNCQSTLMGHTETVRSGVFSPDNQSIATLDAAGRVALWYTASAQKLLEIPGPKIGGVQVAFSGDGKILAVGGALGQVYILRAD